MDGCIWLLAAIYRLRSGFLNLVRFECHLGKVLPRSSPKVTTEDPTTLETESAMALQWPPKWVGELEPWITRLAHGPILQSGRYRDDFRT